MPRLRHLYRTWIRLPSAAVTAVALATSSSTLAAPELTEEQQEAQDRLDELTDEVEADAGAPAPPEMTADQAKVVDEAARKAFDAGDYRKAAADWDRAVRQTAETPQTHLTRYTDVVNAVTSYQQVYEESGDSASLEAAAALLRVYLQQCYEAYGNRCGGLDETRAAKTQLQAADRMVLEHTTPEVQAVPPEEGHAVGGRSFDKPTEPVAVPEWAYATIVLGAGVAAGGTALIVYGTDDKFSSDASAYDFDYRAGDTDGSDTDGSDTTGSTGNGDFNIDLDPETRGKILIGLGSVVAAIGVGLIIHSAIVIGKNRRLNRRRRDRLALHPAFGNNAAGLSVSGRF